MKKYLLIFFLLFSLFLIGCNKQEEKKYLITFYDFNDEVITQLSLPLNSKIEVPLAPSIVGYHFVSWSIDIPEYVSGDLDISALYEKDVYHIKFLNDDGTIIKEEDLKYNENIVYPEAPTKEGYDFISWDSDETKATSDLEIKPKYNIKTYKVDFLDSDGLVFASFNYQYNDVFSIPESNPTKEHYNFVRWDFESNLVSGDLEIKPIFEKVKYLCKFIVDEEVIYECNVAYGEEAICPNIPKIEGYEFISWNQDTTNISNEMEFIAIYEEKTYTVNFYDMYGKLIKTEIVKCNGSATAPTIPTVPYHDFNGWDQEFNEVKSDLNIKATYKAQSTVFSKETSDYWIRVTANKYDVLATILTIDEIKTINQNICNSYSQTKVVDITKINETIGGTTVKSYINSYTNLTSKSVYNANGSTANTTSISNNRNINNIPTTVNVKFGIITDFCNLRSYPTNCYSGSNKTDYFQETSLNVGEGVAIYHESTDGLWYFVEAQNYRGWIEKTSVALCTKEEMVNFLTSDDFVIVTANYLMIDGHNVRMGQRFPVSNSNDTYQMSFPTRLSNGNLSIVKKDIELGDDYHLGYLDYTLENIYIQAFKMIGIDYSWGDKLSSGRDCSSTQNAIFTCFGFKMPRNTSNQRSIPNYSKSVSGVTGSYMKQNYRPGTLIFSSGHVMMFIGEDESGTAYLFHNTSAGSSKCIIQGLDSYGGSKIIGLLYLYKK